MTQTEVMVIDKEQDEGMSSFIFSGFSDEISPDIRRQFQTFNQLGISYFDARNVNGTNISDLNETQRNELLQCMRQYNMRCACIGSPIGKSEITDSFEPQLSKLRNTIKTAKVIGTRYIRIFSFYMPEKGAYSEYKEEVLRRMTAMTEMAEKEDMILLHENEKGIYGDNLHRCLEIFEEINSPHLRAVFDSANFVQCGQEIKQAFKLLKPYIDYVHIKDALATGKVVPAGVGKGEYPWIVNQLLMENYVGFLSIEPHLGIFSGFELLERKEDRKDLDMQEQINEEEAVHKFTVAYKSIKDIVEKKQKKSK